MIAKRLTAADFEGRWTVVRQIQDRRQKQDGEFEGEATLSPGTAAGELRYNERGDIRLGDGPQLEATRAYLWSFGSETVDVTFTDGRAFHSFIPEGQSEGTDHPCGSDLYRVAYDFSDWPCWSAVWKVKGPRKDYTSVSRYEPVDA